MKTIIMFKAHNRKWILKNWISTRVIEKDHKEYNEEETTNNEQAAASGRNDTWNQWIFIYIV